MICKKCGQILGEDTKVCPICKTVQDEIVGQKDSLRAESAQEIEQQPVQTDESHCDEAEYTVEHTIFEKEPKMNVNKKTYPYPPRSRVIAGLLQIFLGGFGIGRFYLGYNKMALGQLFTMPIFFIGNIWGIIDGILILCGQVEYDANGVPLV